MSRRALVDVPLALLRTSFAEAVAYRGEFIVWFLSTNTPLIMLLLWNAVAAEAPVGRFGQREFTAYFLTTLVVRLLTGAWVVWTLNMEVKSGALSMRLVRPLHPFLSFAAENIAAWPLRLVTAAPVIAVVLWLVGAEGFSRDPRQWLLFPLMVATAWSLNFFSMLCIGTLALYWQSSLAVFQAWMTLYIVFSGYIVPLELFPAGLATLTSWLPFRYIISSPVETALGLIDFGASLALWGRQLAYAVVMLALALTLWARGIRRYEAFGG